MDYSTLVSYGAGAMASKLFIGNLSYQTTEDGLRALFEGDSRKVESCTIVSDRNTGRSRGFGFVEMATEEDANAAIDKINGQELDGRPIRVDFATSSR